MANVKVNYSPVAGANNSISFFAGQRPLAAALYKSGESTKEAAARALDISVVLDELGHFSAHANPVEGASQFVVFCATLDVPRTTACPSVDPVIVRIPDRPDVFVRASALGQADGDRSADVLDSFVGFTVDGEVLECVFEPNRLLPASKLIEPGFLDDDRRVGLLSIDPIDLDEQERDELDSTSTLTLIDDDRDNAICFDVPDGVDRLKLTVLRGGELRLEALQEGGLVALEGTLGFMEFQSESEAPPSEFHHESEWETREPELASEASEEPEPEPEQVKDLRFTEDRGTFRLFVSHHSNADGEFATGLVDGLEDCGIRCWVAPRDIRAGANWHRSITKAITECENMVVVVSAASLESDFVQGEVHKALDQKKNVVPLLLEAGLAYTNIDVRLETKQRIDWWKVGDVAGLRLLITSLR